MTTNLKILISFFAIIMVLATASSIWQWYHPKTVMQTEYVKVPEIKEVVKIKRVEVKAPEKIITIEKEKIVEKLHLPAWFSADGNLQAIATATIEPYDGKTNVVATLNIESGEGDIIAKREPLSFMSMESKTYFYMKAGVSTQDGFPLSVGIHRQLLRVKNIHFGLYGEGTTKFNNNGLNDSEASAGIILCW